MFPKNMLMFFIFSYKLFVRFQLLLRHLDAVTRYPPHNSQTS